MFKSLKSVPNKGLIILCLISLLIMAITDTNPQQYMVQLFVVLLFAAVFVYLVRKIR